MGEDIIIVKNVTKSYDKTQVLRDISFTVKSGEWVTILGPSGSGKSTLINILSSLDRPSTGEVVVNGNNLTRMNEDQLSKFRREEIGMVYQVFHLIPYLNAVENVMVAQFFHSIPDEEGAIEALKRVELGHRLDHRPSQLSVGEQQRVCISRAMINTPKILLADEPTGNLDKSSREKIYDIIKRYHDEGNTIILVTHDTRVSRLGNRVLTIEDGGISDTVVSRC